MLAVVVAVVAGVGDGRGEPVHWEKLNGDDGSSNLAGGGGWLIYRDLLRG